MTSEEFIKILEEKGYSYEIEGDKIVVTYKRDVWLAALTSLPPGVEFKNDGRVHLQSLKTISPGVGFKNGGSVHLKSLIGGRFNHWDGNIEGIDDNSLLNLMISKGMFI